MHIYVYMYIVYQHISNTGDTGKAAVFRPNAALLVIIVNKKIKK